MAIQASAIFLGDSRADAPATLAVHRVRRLAREAAERHPSGFGIQYLFHVGGPGHGPGYQGVRTGSFRKATGQKEIQIAVPEVLKTTPEEFLARSLEEGLALAELYFEREQKGVSLDAARQATMEVVVQLRLKSTPRATGDVSMSDWRRIWSEVSRRYIEAKDSQGAIVELFGLYAKLDPDERKAANEELFEAIRAGDDLERWDALAITNKFKLKDALPYLGELAVRLQLDDSPGARFELAKVQRIIERLQSPT
jgi:hypothetical protein